MLLRDLNRDIPSEDIATWVLGDKQVLHSGLHWNNQESEKASPSDKKAFLPKGGDLPFVR